MAKLYELLAAEGPATAQANIIKEETMKTLAKGAMFIATTQVKTYFDADDQKLNMSETTDMTTTVRERLDYTAMPLVKVFDLVLSKDTANGTAAGDVMLGDAPFLTDVPVATLLYMEKHLKDFRDSILAKAPTLPAGVPVRQVMDRPNLYETNEPVVTFQTKKTLVPLLLAPATDKHPAQVKEGYEDRAIAKIEKTQVFGLISSGAKEQMLSRIDNLLIEFKKARQRANDHDVTKRKMGDAMFAYIFDGTVQTVS